MTATKLIAVYRYQSGDWENIEPMHTGYAFELWNGTHDDTVTVIGFEDDGHRRVSIDVAPQPYERERCLEGDIQRPTRFSAVYKWGYAHAVIYGAPRTPHDPYVAVLEIAEDAFLDYPVHTDADNEPSPHPYLAYVQLAFATHAIFADSFPDLTQLLGEVLPLVGNPAPREVDIYDLHKWEATWGRVPLRFR